jgi:hypothetical protein
VVAAVFAVMQKSAADVFADPFKSRLLEHVLPRDHPKQFVPQTFESSQGDIGNGSQFVGQHLVHDRANHLDGLPVKSAILTAVCRSGGRFRQMSPE